MMEEEQPPHVGIRTSLSETYEEIRLILRDGFDGKRQIKDVCMKRKTWDTISFVIPFPRSSFLLPDIQIFGYSL